MRKVFVGTASALCVCLAIWAATPEKIDLSVLHRIKAEAFERSKVMDNAFYLTDVYGPRLTGSPNIKQAGEWAVKQMTAWGLSNAKMEPWGPFGRGWSCTRFVAMMKEPEFQPLIGFAQPWSPGTNGEVSGETVLAVLTRPEELEKFKGKLKGKIVLIAAPHASELSLNPLAHRFTDAELAAAETAPDPAMGNPAGLPLGFVQGPAAAQRGGRNANAAAPGGPGGPGAPNRDNMRRFRNQLNQFLADEGVLLVLRPGTGPDG
ncbi:MAG TPA: hypothetical protein VGV35_13365, partial [Bryobacteraceae bacterium]|nr:hypothetical protein [Bryobacteraceae bacterium]